MAKARKTRTSKNPFVSNNSIKARKRLFVHLGMYKTGSTSIQYFLNSIIDRLFDLGYLYPTSARHPRAFAQHQLLAEVFSKSVAGTGDFALGSTPDKDLIIASLKHEIMLADKPNVILSAEMFSGFEEPAVDDFYHTFKEYDITPIMFLRDYARLAGASYATQIMTNATSLHFDDCGYSAWPDTLDIAQTCRNWARRAYNSKIVLLNFDAMANSNVIMSFGGVIGLPMSSFESHLSTMRWNQSLSPALVVLNQALRAKGHSIEAARALVSQLSTLVFEPNLTNVPHDLRQELNTKYLQHIEALVEEGLASAEEFDLDEIREKQNVEWIHISSIEDAVLTIGRAMARA